MKKIWRSCTSLLLALCLLVGVCGNGLVILAADAGNDEIKYVALGDSMTNGYGLDGYEYEYHCHRGHNSFAECNSDANAGWTQQDGLFLKCWTDVVECTDPNCTENHLIYQWANGYRQTAWEGYPNLLAEKYGWDLTQLAMSATRVEDLRWILEFDLNNELAKEIVTMNEWNKIHCDDEEHDGCSDCLLSSGKTVEEVWNEVFAAGDYYTFNKFPDGNLEVPYPNPYYKYQDKDYVLDVIADYQNTVKNADVISLCIGNGNFGVAMLNRLQWAFGGHDDRADYPLETAIRDLTPEAQEQVKALSATLHEKLDLVVLDEETKEKAIDIVLYTVASYISNFNGLFDTILEMNPTAEIILLGMIPSMNNMTLVLEDGTVFDLGNFVDIGMAFANEFTATVVAEKLQNERHSGNKVYYAEAGADVELLYEKFADTVYSNNATVPARFIESLYEEGDADMWAFAEAVAYELGLDWTDEMTIEHVRAYKAGNTAGMDDAMINTIELYIGLADAVIHSCDNGALTVGGMAALGQMNNGTEAAENFMKAGVEKVVELYDANGDLSKAMTEGLLSNDLIRGAFYQYARCDLANFLGNHPTADGHKVLFESIVKAYDGKYTVQDEADVAEQKMIDIIMGYLKENGYIDAAEDAAIEYALELTEEVKEILKKNLKPLAEQLEGELKVLNSQYMALTAELDEKLADLAEKQAELIDGMNAEREALVAELEALNEKLIAVKNGNYTRTVPTTDALDAMIADLEAAIAETKAEIAELDEAIAWAYEQITADKSGIEAIKAAIASIKEDIIATEAALAEVNAAIEQLVADLHALDDALLVLADAAQHLANKTGVEIDVKEVLNAAITLMKNLPALIEHLQWAYDVVVETVEKVQTAVAEIKASAAVIKAQIEAIVDGAEEIVDIAGEQADAILATLDEMHDLAVELVEENLPDVIDAFINIHDELKAVALRELAEAKQLYKENEDLIMAALAIGYWYAEEKGYIQDAKDLIFEYTDLTQEDLDALKEDLGYAEVLLERYLEMAEKHIEEKIPVVEAEIERLYAELVAYGETIDPEIKAEYERAIAVLKAQKVELEKKLDEIEAVIIAVREYFAGVKAAIENVALALEGVEEALLLVNGDIQALINALENLKAALCKLAGSVEELHDAVVNEVNRVLGYAGIVADEAFDVIASLQNFVELVNHLPAILKEAVIHATNDHYLVSQNSHFVALGDANAYGPSADLLAEHLSSFLGAEVSYENATVAGQTAAELLALLPELEETLAKADLVTVNFSANAFTQFVVDQVSGVAMGGEVTELDWESMLGAEGAAYIAEAMEELKAELVSNGAGEVMGIDVADLLALAIESYAYAYAEFVINYVQVVGGVHAINPEAQVVLVGMHNPMTGIVLDMNGSEIALGDYLQYIIEASNAYAFAYAFIVPQTIYVDAPAVETATEAGTQSAITFLMNLLMLGTDSFVPTEDGYAYIEEQIWNALNAYKKGMLGDVNNDGKVNPIDAMLVLRYYTGKITAADLDLSVADVDGNGKYNPVDAMLILRYYTGKIPVFPAAN